MHSKWKVYLYCSSTACRTPGVQALWQRPHGVANSIHSHLTGERQKCECRTVANSSRPWSGRQTKERRKPGSGKSRRSLRRQGKYHLCLGGTIPVEAIGLFHRFVAEKRSSRPLNQQARQELQEQVIQGEVPAALRLRKRRVESFRAQRWDLKTDLADRWRGVSAVSELRSVERGQPLRRKDVRRVFRSFQFSARTIDLKSSIFQ
jgi:hypothetical protein